MKKLIKQALVGLSICLFGGPNLLAMEAGATPDGQDRRPLAKVEDIISNLSQKKPRDATSHPIITYLNAHSTQPEQELVAINTTLKMPPIHYILTQPKFDIQTKITLIERLFPGNSGPIYSAMNQAHNYAKLYGETMRTPIHLALDLADNANKTLVEARENLRHSKPINSEKEKEPAKMLVLLIASKRASTSAMDPANAEKTATERYNEIFKTTSPNSIKNALKNLNIPKTQTTQQRPPEEQQPATQLAAAKAAEKKPTLKQTAKKIINVLRIAPKKTTLTSGQFAVVSRRIAEKKTAITAKITDIKTKIAEIKGGLPRK